MGEPVDQRVLVIEDDPLLRDGLIRMLDKIWTVAGACDLAEGLARLSEGGYSAVMLDLGLPDTQGLEGLTRLRLAYPLLAIIVVTGQTDESLALRALALGAQEYLVKGRLDRRELERTLRYALQRKQAERASLNTNMLLASTLDAFRSAIAIVGREGRIFATNARWREWAVPSPFVTGLGPGSDYLALCRRHVGSAHMGTDVAAKGILAVAEGRLPTFKVDFPNEMEPPEWLGISIAGFRIEGSVHLLVCVSNLTEQVVRTSEMKRHQHLFKLITDHTTDLIAIADKSGRRLYESPSYSQLLGWTKAELDETAPLDLVHPEDRDKIRQALKEVFRSGKGNVLTYRMRTKSGDYLTFESHSSVVRDPDGGAEAALFSARDVTSRIEAEAERDRLEVQLRSAQKLESIGQLAAGIAHEINTPIQYIGDNTRFLRDSFDEFTAIIAKQREVFAALDLATVPQDLLRQLPALLSDPNFDYLSAEIPRATEETLEGVGRVANIIKALKEFSYPMGEDPVMMDVNRCIETTLVVAKNEWKYFADVVSDLEPGLPSVPGFPGEFNQVVLNLVVNGVHAIQDVLKERGEEKGRITLRTWLEGAFVHVEVSDTGKGIPGDIQNRVFDPFFTTKGVGKGTGQGLSIAHTVMEKHQGGISFRSQVGEGTTFLLRLPLIRSETPRGEAG